MNRVERIVRAVGRREVILAGIVVLQLAPILWYGVPDFCTYPDVIYVQAKTAEVLRGNLFTDPITGLVTMHPPWYHVFLAPWVAAGIPMHTLLIMVTIFNVSMIFFFSYKILSAVYDRTAAFMTVAAVPFIIEFMGSHNILLATAFYFSFPFFLAGAAMYVRRRGSLRYNISAGVLWGISFLLSPVYLFFIAFVLAYDIVVRRTYRESLVMAGVFAVVSIPFLVQAGVVYQSGLWGARTFAFWRGIPDTAWLHNLVIEFISPTNNTLLAWPALFHILLLVTGLLIVIGRRQAHRLMVVTLVAYIMTYYHFSPQYAIRLQYLFSLFLVGLVFGYLGRYRAGKIIVGGAAVIMLALWLQTHVFTVWAHVGQEKEEFTAIRRAGTRLWSKLPEVLPEDKYIFCEKDVYLYYILGRFPARALAAYFKLDYFQLPARISDAHDEDYTTVIHSDEYAVIDSIARKYNIRAAVVSRSQWDIPLFRTLKDRWKPVYNGVFFTVLRKPGET